MHDELKSIAQSYPVVTLTGPRQSGKTTLVKEVFGNKPYANLESLQTRELAETDPIGFLDRYPDGAVLDERSGRRSAKLRPPTPPGIRFRTKAVD